MEFEISADYNASEVLFHNLQAGREGKVAVYCGDQKVTYGELAEAASRVGNGLLKFGLERGDRVLLVLLDSPEFPAAFFGAMRAGLIPVPVNTLARTGDYEYFLKDSQARAALVSASLYEKLEPIVGLCPELEQVVVTGGESPEGTQAWQKWTGAAEAELAPATTRSDEPAFWLYSSGSTGTPKAVVHCHLHIPFTVEAYAKQILEIGPDDLVFSASKAFHAYGLGNSFNFPFSVGASSVLLPGRPEPEAVFEHIDRYRPSLVFTAPTLYASMLALPDAEERWDLASVRLCVSAAEALPADVYQRWLERFEIEILDGLGSTELLHIFISNRPGEARPGSSGRLVPGYETRLLNEQGWPVPPGKPGELLVRGVSAFSQYWNRPDDTERVRLEDWIVTGDQYIRDDEGYYFCQGRSDDMMKVGGNWVSPAEVESTLMEHSSVLECAVVGFKDREGLVKPQAFVVLQKGNRASKKLARDLQQHVKSKISHYKYPRRIEFVKSLPKTATGKIQRFQLREGE
ncbi:MAG: benzoate-CoA ligase family protein [Acidobacteriota bacterium]